MSRRELESIQGAAADIKAAALKLAAAQEINLRYSARRCSDVLALVHMALDSCGLDSATEICGQIAQDRREIDQAIRFAEKTRMMYPRNPIIPRLRQALEEAEALELSDRQQSDEARDEKERNERRDLEYREIRALEALANAFQRISETLQQIACTGITVNRR